MKNLGLYNNDMSTPRKQDVDEKQKKIDVVGILQGDGDGSVSVAETVAGAAASIPSGILKGEDGALAKAQPGTDYADSTLGIVGATVGKVVSIKSVDGAGQPTAYEAVDAGGSGDSNVFVITLTRKVVQDDSDNIAYTADKTNDEVLDAIKANMQCYALCRDIYYPLTNLVFLDNVLVSAYFSALIANDVYFQITFDVMRTNTWTSSLTTVAAFPVSPSDGQILAYRSGLKSHWDAYNLGTRIATDFTGIIKGASGKLAQAEAGTDYMSPVPVETADNGKIMQVVNGAWTKAEQSTETWIFTLADGSTVTKSVVVTSSGMLS